MKLAIEYGADIHSTNEPLRTASIHGDVDFVKFLIEHGVNVNSDYGSALKHAAEYGHVDVVRVLFEHGASADPYALNYALKNNHFDVAELLVAHGTDISYAINSNCNGILLEAVKDNNLNAVNFLIENGVSTRDGYNAALQIAVEKGYTDIADALNDYKVVEKVKEIQQELADGKTAEDIGENIPYDIVNDERIQAALEGKEIDISPEIEDIDDSKEDVGGNIGCDDDD
jgi:ankyrin repeat protein